MTIPIKIDLKILAAPGSPHARDLIPVFHRWIQTEALDELMIDVADYSHVPEGPGVLLVGHDAHYGFDQGGDGPGLVYSRRRQSGAAAPDSDEVRLRSVFDRALAACSLLEGEPELGGVLRFPCDRLELSVNDRMIGGNDPLTDAALRPLFVGFVERLFDAAPTAVEPERDPRARYALRFSLPDAPGPNALRQRLRAPRLTPVV